MSGFDTYSNTLNHLKTRGRYRMLSSVKGSDFASNDYLGLANSKCLREAAFSALEAGVGLGSGASRLLRGNHCEHEALEDMAAKFFGSPKALFFTGGFVANTAIFSTLPRSNDLIIYDELIHASVHDGMRLGKAKSVVFLHNDLNHLEKLIQHWHVKSNPGRVWIAFETVYSMDGDLAPIEGLVILAQKYDAILVADEAHATGVFGQQGRGLMHQFEGQTDIITLHTCGKALGVSGALVCAAIPLIEMLINKARGFIFATAPSPLNAKLVQTSLQVLQQNKSPHIQLKNLMKHAAQEAIKCGLPSPKSQIIPVIIGQNKQTMTLSSHLQTSGFDVRGIRPPTVRRGTARLRISITLNVSKQEISDMFLVLSKELKRHSNA